MGSSIEGKWGIRVQNSRDEVVLGPPDVIGRNFLKKKENFKKLKKCHTLFKSITYINFK